MKFYFKHMFLIIIILAINNLNKKYFVIFSKEIEVQEESEEEKI